VTTAPDRSVGRTGGNLPVLGGDLLDELMYRVLSDWRDDDMNPDILAEMMRDELRVGGSRGRGDVCDALHVLAARLMPRAREATAREMAEDGTAVGLRHTSRQ